MSNHLNQIQNWHELAKQANWSVSALAKLCSVSTRTLERHFIKQIGQNPKVWLAKHRQHLALELRRDALRIKEIAGRLGYAHPNQFSREFKKRWGYSPTGKKQPTVTENEETAQFVP